MSDLRRGFRCAVAGLAVFACLATAGVAQQKSGVSYAQKVSALQGLRDTGVISEAEYEQKVAALKAPSPAAGSSQKLAALKDLRDTGVISDAEYRQKVAALQGATTSTQGAPAATQAAVKTAAAHTGELPGRPTVDHTLPDQGWGLPWGTIKLPAGWGFNGGVVHAGTQGCVASGDSPMWSAESQDKMFGVAMLPLLKTNWTSDPQLMRIFQQMHCPIVASEKAADYLTKYVLPQLHHNFRVVAVGQEEQFAQPAQQVMKMNAQLDQMAGGGQFMQTHRSVDTARVLVQYEENGRTVNEIASALISCTVTTRHSMVAMAGRPAQTQTIECMDMATMLIHGPDEGTPFTLASVEAENARRKNMEPFFKTTPSQAWNQRSNQAAQATSQRIQNESNARSNAGSSGPADNSQTEFAKQQAIRKGVQDHRSAVINGVNANRQAANAQVTGAFVAHTGDYNYYTNPATGQQVQLSNQYNNTYVNQDGTVALQTNSASSPGVNWQLMTPKY